MRRGKLFPSNLQAGIAGLLFCFQPTPARADEDLDHRKEITTPQGKSFSFRSEANGRDYEFTGAWQPELEMRINIPSRVSSGRRIRYKASSTPLGRLLDLFGKNNFADEHASPLDAKFPSKARENTIGLRCLEGRASYSDGFHGYDNTHVPPISLSGDRFKGIVQGGVLYPTPWDSSSFKRVNEYVVGHRKERAIYFDTSNLLFLDQNVAIRLKEWYPKDFPLSFTGRADPQCRLARVLTVKIDLGDIDLFHNRMEFQLTLPDDIPERSIPKIAEDMLRAISRLKQSKLRGSAALSIPDSFHLEPIRQVNTERQGVDLVWGEKKIGFVTTDRVVARDLRDWKPVGPRTKFKQMEFELLPHEEPLYRRHRDEISLFFREIESSLEGAQRTTTPKYKNNFDPNRWLQQAQVPR